ncbi:serine/threonine protein phosphatase [Acidilutibacter cellobiosedens]|jgi:protein phosphatase|uniref:Serine/threonine protein phosphatase n=2 Tax=Acidilutibacter cellobiosedens TaxID=2507161 RepID=A0A410QC06_9FIRM|nr:serine/threonine protein phosphatase [Acidilutibacter cellobiosedens]
MWVAKTHIGGSLMKTTVKKINIPNYRRLIVTSDIHGHYRYLKRLLEKVDLSEKDILFIIGDIIEKGPESLRTLRYIIKFCKEYSVYPLMGNVDAWQLVMLDDDSTENCERLFNYIVYMKKHWGSCFFTDMCDELNLCISTSLDILEAKQRIRENFRAEIEFLHSLPTIIETKNFIFVHGGLPTADIDSLIGTDAFPYLKNDAFMDKNLYFSKYVIVGHWPVTLYNDKIASSNPIINHKQKIISIDGGCGLKRDGQLNAFIIPDINSTDFIFESYDEFPVYAALTPQEASTNSINIRYTDNKIKILEKGDEFSYAEHSTTGYCLPILNSYIYSFDENATCDDYTDYRLPVNVGDKISIVKKTSKGYLAKKNGISGWYYGELKPFNIASSPLIF